MNDAQERKKIDDAVRHRLLAEPTLDAAKIDAMMGLAYQTLRLAIVPGRSGFNVRPDDISRFIADLSKRSEFGKDGGKAVDPTAVSFSAEEFRSLSPLQRLRIIDSGVTQGSDGRFTRFQRP